MSVHVYIIMSESSWACSRMNMSGKLLSIVVSSGACIVHRLSISMHDCTCVIFLTPRMNFFLEIQENYCTE